MRCLLVIPALNEGRFLGRVLEGALKHFSSEDILVVSDGSDDDTEEIAHRRGVRVLSHARREGKGRCLRDGFALALEEGYDTVLTMDGDGQHDPACLPAFLAARDNSTLVAGSRRRSFRGAGMPRDRYLSNRLTSLAVSLLSGRRVSDSQSGYRLIPVGALGRVPVGDNGYTAESELLVKALRSGVRLEETDIPVIYGGEKSKLNRPVEMLRALWLAIRLVWR